MKYLTRTITLLVFSLGLSANAQVIQKQDTISGNPVTISLDKRIDQLLTKQEDNCVRSTTTSTTSSTEPATPKVTTPARELTNSEICRKNPKIMGYKIQVAVVKSNEEARTIGANFRKSFPSMKVEIDASLRPNYKVLAGSYFTKQSAADDLRRVKSQYESAVSVQYRVFCVEAK